ncbi:MBOAT family O-acyltransferase [Litoreibacter roseus]|uniref:Probable alginate O-acetylase AlgI n=1 Tax=Litoreibacter roseus TaxID=2601869 RepID=A0A6N6JAE5_9RHOB|nr:MBOAT family protein [Litoreibacter roseus]GFE63201.1 poly(beta-D-mannuronate) O-acetylase [Litoreibacter roseus]
MVFSSESFLFLFLPLFLLAYYATPVRWRSATILVGSYTFYAWWRIDFLGLLILTTVWAYGLGALISRHRGTAKGRMYLTIAVTGCLGVLGIFKYLNFFLDSIAALVGTDVAGLGIHWRLILPIGISFYVFQSISYLVDVHRGDAKANATLLDFAAFIALFPQLIAGPILRYKDLEDQFRQREHSVELFCDGMARFIIGLAKKVLLADAIAPLADLAFAAEDPSMALAWFGAAAYMLQLYFDFSGYSSMAIGLGMMMGFRFIENFNMPYISRSITEFWRRWHISLSVWLRDYLYIPLGGNRSGVARTYMNLMIVMTLGGLWHGANWTFVLWGIWHGGILAIERATGWDKSSSRHLIALPMTLLFVLIGWVMFRAATVDEAFGVYAGMIGLNGLMPDPSTWQAVTRESLALLIVAFGIAASEPWLRGIFRPDPAIRISASGAAALTRSDVVAQATLSVAVTVIGALTIMKLAEQSFSPFLYFQF